jgi:hypothetical protein
MSLLMLDLEVTVENLMLVIDIATVDETFIVVASFLLVCHPLQHLLSMERLPFLANQAACDSVESADCCL